MQNPTQKQIISLFLSLPVAEAEQTLHVLSAMCGVRPDVAPATLVPEVLSPPTPARMSPSAPSAPVRTASPRTPRPAADFVLRNMAARVVSGHQLRTLIDHMGLNHAEFARYYGCTQPNISVMCDSKRLYPGTVVKIGRAVEMFLNHRG